MSGHTEYRVSLRVRHPTKRAEEIASSLGLSSHISQSEGDPRKTPKGTALDGVYDKTYVSFSVVRVDHEEIEDVLRRTFEETLEQKMAYISDLVATGGKLEFFVGIFLEHKNIGFEVDVDLIERLAAAKIALAVDIYPPEPLPMLPGS